MSQVPKHVHPVCYVRVSFLFVWDLLYFSFHTDHCIFFCSKHLFVTPTQHWNSRRNSMSPCHNCSATQKFCKELSKVVRQNFFAEPPRCRLNYCSSVLLAEIHSSVVCEPAKIFLTSKLLGFVAIACLLQPSANCAKLWAKSACFDFSSSNFKAQARILRCSGIAFTKQIRSLNTKNVPAPFLCPLICKDVLHMPCVNFQISSLHLVTLVRLRVLDFLEFHNLPLMHLVLSPNSP